MVVVAVTCVILFFSGRRHRDVSIFFITVNFFRGLLGKAQSARFSALPRDCLVLNGEFCRDSWSKAGTCDLFSKRLFLCLSLASSLTRSDSCFDWVSFFLSLSVFFRFFSISLKFSSFLFLSLNSLCLSVLVFAIAL